MQADRFPASLVRIAGELGLELELSIYPPAGDADPRSFWDVLHDAHVVTVESDLLARRLSILVDIPHLRRFAHVADDVRWRLVVDDASALWARSWEPWPGPPPSLTSLSRDQESVAVADYQAKGRTVSLGWTDFELAANTKGIWLKNAGLREAEAGVVFSAAGNERETDRFLEFEVTGRLFRCERTDGGAVPLAELLRLGEEYWEAFAKRQSNDDGS
jgi:hypothetical protein